MQLKHMNIRKKQCFWLINELSHYFYIEPAVADFLPGFLQQQAYDAGNWVLPGLVESILPVSQRVLRALGVSGPLWRLFQKP